MSISCTDEYIDGSELEAEMESIRDDITWHEEEITDRKAENKVTEKFEEGLAELKEMLAPMEELESDISYFALSDVTLICWSAFEDYAMRLAIDCGDISEDSSVFAYVDWDRHAQDVQVDYTSVYFDNVEYLYHS